MPARGGCHRLSAIRRCSTKLRPSTAMDVFTDQQSLALGDVLLLLEAEFADAEREYQHADMDTDQEEDTEEREEDASAERLQMRKMTMICRTVN